MYNFLLLSENTFLFLNLCFHYINQVRTKSEEEADSNNVSESPMELEQSSRYVIILC